MAERFMFEKMDEEKNDLLVIEHYKRCKDFCLSYNNTIWSMPSVATAINVGTYYAIFDSGKQLEPFIIPVTLFILTLLNVALFIGVKRHLHFQRQFGKRLMEIEKQNGLPSVDLDNGSWFIKSRAGETYVFSMLVISLVSFSLFIFKLLAYMNC